MLSSTLAVTAWATRTIGSKYHGIAAQHALFRAARREAGNLAALGHQRPADAGRAFGFLDVEFCLWDAQDDATNFQRNFSIGRSRNRRRRHLSQDRYRERRDHFAWFACSVRWPASTHSARLSSDHGGVGTNRRRWSGAQSSNSHGHGWSPIGVAPCAAGARSPAKRARSFLFWAITRTPRTKNSIRRIRRSSTRRP